MIRPEQIPDEVVEAAAMVLHANNEVFHDVSWDDLGDYDQEAYREEARAAIAAALNAWPGAIDCGDGWIELPLPQEGNYDYAGGL
jgi:hypothetical protein